MSDSSPENWKIELQCPQCGGPVVLEETDRIFGCVYCRVRLFIAPQEHFRYFLSPREGPQEEVLFVPYWRFRGTVFSCERAGVRQRFMDTSSLAVRAPGLPASLGVRPQVLRLRFVTSETPWRFLRPDTPFHLFTATAFGEVENNRGVERFEQRFFEAFIGEAISLIHAPVLVRGRRLVDAVLNRSLGPVPEGWAETLSPAREAARPVHFIPTLCPECGWDLHGERDSRVLVCRNCNSAWEPGAERMRRRDFSSLEAMGEAALHLPFWRLKVAIAGIDLKSYADFARLANLPRAIQAQWQDWELHFWVPAFKVHPQLFLRLAKVLTVHQPRDGFIDRLPQTPLYPVTLPEGEALESIKIHLASWLVPKRWILPRLSELKVEAVESQLLFVPFTTKGNEFVHPQMQLSISRSALRIGRLL